MSAMRTSRSSAEIIEDRTMLLEGEPVTPNARDAPSRAISPSYTGTGSMLDQPADRSGCDVAGCWKGLCQSQPGIDKR